MRNLLTFRWIPAFLGLKRGLTYRYDIKRGKIIGWNPAEGKNKPRIRTDFFQSVKIRGWKYAVSS
jgi:hypothetical protein